MSKFQELSQAIGVSVHKATKEWDNADNPRPANPLHYIIRRPGVRNAVKELVNHTIQNTGDNE